MKKNKKWWLSLATIVSASLIVGVGATSILNTNLNTNAQSNNLLNNLNDSMLRMTDISNADLSHGLNLQSSKVPQILPSLFVDNSVFGFDSSKIHNYDILPNKKQFVIDFYKFLGKDVATTISNTSPLSASQSFNVFNQLQNYASDSTIQSEVQKLIQYRQEWVKQSANAGLNPKTANWSKKTQAYYDARKALNQSGFIYSYIETDANNKILDTNDPLIESSLSTQLETKKVLMKYNNSDEKYIIKFRFSHTSGLNLNNLANYLEITNDSNNQDDKSNWTLRFNLYKMRKDLGGLDWLTKKNYVFDLNGLHDFFDVTYQTFWEKVIDILNAKGYDTTGLTAKPDETNNKNQTFKNNNLLSVALAPNTKTILVDNANYLPNQKGWVTPVDTNGELDYLIFKSIGTQVENIVIPTKQVTDWTWLLIVLGVIIVLLLIIIICLLIRNRKQGGHSRYKV